MTSSSPSSDRPPATVATRTQHSGHDLETGVLARARDWVDVFGWIRLGRVMRVAASPFMLALTAVTTAIWLVGWNYCWGHEAGSQWPPLSARAVDESLWERPLWYAIAWADLIIAMMAAALFMPQADLLGWARLLASVVWTVALWAPTAMILQRQGALLTAGRPMLPLSDVAPWVLWRYWRAMAAAIVPALGIASIVWVVVPIGWVLRSVETPWVTIPASFLIACFAIPSGLLAFGSLFAVPIGWAALINERDPDPLDSLSRGYEYLYRRPLQLAGAMLVSLVILVVVSYLATCVMIAGAWMVGGPLRLAGADGAWNEAVADWLGLGPLVLVYTVFWSLVGGMYLLLRRNAGGQEVEDLWIAPAYPPQPLPEIKSSP